MARGKPTVTRTFAPIHSEDLDPHRFEDLIRELIYDFRDWQSIEATGRAGSDDGFDIRAFVKVPVQEQSDEEEEPVEARHPMDGPRWMIQGKREKTLTPADVKKILADVDAKDPPYGYILAASAVFSKRSYDLFRDELRKKGVMEFYLWGRPELEDMLHLPKNDRILFTFFGISLVSRRRSRTAETRSAVTTKNKLYRVLGDPQSMHERNVLIRDIADDHYPYKGDYPDFDKKPRWVERVVSCHHPNGLLIRSREFFAYVDRRKKEWDYTQHADALVFRRDVLTDDERQQQLKKETEVRNILKFLPRTHQGIFEIEGMLAYADILVVDPEGDAHHHHPYLYAEFSGPLGPYCANRTRLSVGDEEIELDDTWRRIDFFPKSFSGAPAKPRIPRTEKISLDPDVLKGFRDYGPLDTLYAVDNRFDFLSQGDIVAVAESAREAGDADRLLQILHIHRGPFVEYLKDRRDHFGIRHNAMRQIGRDIDDEEPVTILEVERTHEQNSVTEE
jgi:hypothetical protein